MTIKAQELGNTRDFDFVLVLSGGNALGAFEAGVYETLHEYNLRPDWVVGASIGAVNGSLIAGSTAERRLDALRAFWTPDTFGMAKLSTSWLPGISETARRTAATSWTMMAGRAGIFGPPLSTLLPWTKPGPAIFETDQLAATLASLVDFDVLNGGVCRYTATAVDLATGDDVVFDSAAQRIGVQHIRASAALPVAFPPVEVDGRWLVDASLSANLPLDPVLAEPAARPTLCVAVDLLPLHQALPRTVGEAASRMQDLIFAAQSRRTIARWKAVHAGRRDIALSLVRLAYSEQGAEVAGKAMDFSPDTIEQRWAAGRLAGMTVIDHVRDSSSWIDQPGLTVLSDKVGSRSETVQQAI